MENIRDETTNKDTCVIALMFYEIKSKNPMKLYRVLISILYYLIKNYVCIDYICCQYKTLSGISSDIILEQTSHNILIGISIT